MEGVSMEMPRYQSHKQVHAMKIADIVLKPNPDTTGQTGAASYGALLIPVEPGYAGVVVDAAYVTKHSPQVGGYYVVYEDGYKSFSPAAAFESGYTRV